VSYPVGAGDRSRRDLERGILPEGDSRRSRCGVLGVALNAPEPDEVPSGMRGNRDEAMTRTYIGAEPLYILSL